MMELTRRQALGAIGSFAGLGLLPSWRAFAQRRNIDLTPFCDDHDYRYSISQPFAQDGMVYGTDGRIMCRTTLADVPKLGEGAKLPAASKLPWWAESKLEWQPWPKLNLKADGCRWSDTCPMCWGRGGFGNVRKCDNCDGDGDVPDENGWNDALTWYPCAACKTSGHLVDLRCDYCDGTGATYRPALQQVGKLVIAGHYDSRVRNLGDVEYAIVGGHEHDLTGPLVKFRGDGFEGLLMPMLDRGGA